MGQGVCVGVDVGEVDLCAYVSLYACVFVFVCAFLCVCVSVCVCVCVFTDSSVLLHSFLCCQQVSVAHIFSSLFLLFSMLSTSCPSSCLQQNGTAGGSGD